MLPLLVNAEEKSFIESFLGIADDVLVRPPELEVFLEEERRMGFFDNFLASESGTVDEQATRRRSVTESRSSFFMIVV
jgi:hypothetical protein